MVLLEHKTSEDISGAVGRFFQDATSGAATALVAAAFGPAQEAFRRGRSQLEMATNFEQNRYGSKFYHRGPQVLVLVSFSRIPFSAPIFDPHSNGRLDISCWDLRIGVQPQKIGGSFQFQFID